MFGCDRAGRATWSADALPERDLFAHPTEVPSARPRASADRVPPRERGQHAERIEEVREQFRRHGWQIVVVGRLLPAGRIPVLLAAGAFPRGARIPPQFAGLGEIVSVLPVIAAAVALRWARI